MPLRDNSDEVWELQAKLVYAVLVAGKTAKFAEEAFGRMLGDRIAELPFDVLRSHVEQDSLLPLLKTARTGNYQKLVQCLPVLIDLDPTTCTIRDLEEVHGIGSKTARFFMLWTRPGVRCAALDTHILKWLRAQGYDAPKSTPPSGPRYDELEQAFLREADERGVTPRELDLQIWDTYANPQGVLL